MDYLGEHLVIDIHECDRRVISDKDKIIDVLKLAINHVKMRIVKIEIHEFQPYGLSGIFILAESHLTFHTWPEYGILTIDVFTCNISVDLKLILPILLNEFNGIIGLDKKIKRGYLKGGESS